MQCQRCGKELGNSTQCNFCGYDNKEGNVREMSSLEKNFYDGVTIDTGNAEEKNSSNSNSYSRNNNYRFSQRKIYISNDTGIFSRFLGKLLSGLLNNSLLSKIAVTLIALAFGALMFFVALPVLFVLLATGIALFAFSKLGR